MLDDSTVEKDEEYDDERELEESKSKTMVAIYSTDFM